MSIVKTKERGSEVRPNGPSGGWRFYKVVGSVKRKAGGSFVGPGFSFAMKRWARFHHTSIRSRLGTMMAFSDSLFCFKGRPVAQSDTRSWLDQRHIPEHPGMRTSPCTAWYGASPTRLFIIDPAGWRIYGGGGGVKGKILMFCFERRVVFQLCGLYLWERLQTVELFTIIRGVS